MTAKEEICNLSDDSLIIIQNMLQVQYKCGFEYATECWGGDMRLSEVKDALDKVLVPIEPEYLRALIKARV